MKSKLWNGGFLRTVLQGLAVTCAALLALSALGAGLTLGGVIGQQQLSAAAVVISFLGVFPGAWLTARHAAGQNSIRNLWSTSWSACAVWRSVCWLGCCSSAIGRHRSCPGCLQCLSRRLWAGLQGARSESLPGAEEDEGIPACVKK